MKGFLIYVTGIVQGVGFRPFIKRIAYKSGVNGYVRNLGGGEVEIYIEGDVGRIRKFFILFYNERPPPAEIFRLRIKEVEKRGANSFEILRSGSSKVVRSMIPPDIGICDECIKEIDGDTRWNRYPFNSCAYCGPRFSMMYNPPYDRENTAMMYFPLCVKCKAEYGDMFNPRRFHAQGISCPECGPRIWLADAKGIYIEADDPIREAAKLIDGGYIIGIKGIGGFHIACRADDDEIVERLRRRKHRPYKPFAIMARDLNVLKRIVHVDDKAELILKSPQKPILLLRKREDAAVSKYVAPGLSHLGVFLPYSGIHHLLMKYSKPGYLIMTSGNFYGKPMEITNEGAIKRIGSIVDYFLFHDREIVNRVDDSVLRFSNGRLTFLRRSRGYAPRWIVVDRRFKKDVIAFGADLQNTGAIGFENKIMPTQYIGDLEDFDVVEDLNRYLEWFIRVYDVDIRNSIIAFDKHPSYYSRLLGIKWADKYGSETREIQHHVAHAYSVLAEYNADHGIVIAIDGLGYGDDGNIWGGEIIWIDKGEYRRLAHLKYYKMLGKDLSVLYPARMLFSILSEELGIEYASKIFSEKRYINYLRDERELEVLIHRYSFERIYTSSTGRLLDSFSTLLNICGYRSYEGEPAMKLEAFSYGGELVKEMLRDIKFKDGSEDVIDLGEVFVKALDLYINKPSLARDLGYTIQYIIGYSLGIKSIEFTKEYGEKYVYISGGAAVNDIILKGLEDLLRDNNLTLRVHRIVPPGDGGISLGQVYSCIFTK